MSEVCIKLEDDGSLSVSIEQSEAVEPQTEGEEESNKMPARDAKDALRIAGQMLQELMAGAQAPAQAEEDAAFAQEMAK